MDTTNTPISRRGVLKSLGFAGAAVVSSPLIGSATESLSKATTAFSGPASTPTVGLMLQKGKTRVRSSSLLNGFQLYCSEYQSGNGSLPFNLVIEETGIGASSVSRTMHRLIETHRITMAVGMINSKVSSQLAAEFDEAKVPFVEVNHGENFFHKDLASEYVFQSSLNLWQSNYALGVYAARHLGTEAVSVGSFTDCSFDAHFAFEAGFNAAGGTVISSIVTGSPVDLISPLEAASKAASSSAPVVFCNYSGHDGALFLSKLQESMSGTKSVVASGLVSQPALRSYFSNSGAGVITAHTWQGSLSGDTFSGAYHKAYGYEPDEEALLGYDTAKMLCAVVTASATLLTNLKQATLSSARGSLKMNAHTHSLEAPISIYKVGSLGEPHSLLSVVPIPDALSSGTFRLTTDVRSGAIATYPHIS